MGTGTSLLRKIKEAENRNFKNNRALLAKLQEIIDTSGVSGAEKVIAVEPDTDSMYCASPWFEVLCEGRLYSNFLSFDEAENLLRNMVKGMQLAKSPALSATEADADEYVVVRKPHGFDGEDHAVRFSGPDAYDEAVGYMKRIWKDYLREEEESESFLDKSGCYCGMERARVTWDDGCYTEFILAKIEKPYDEFTGGETEKTE